MPLSAITYDRSTHLHICSVYIQGTVYSLDKTYKNVACSQIQNHNYNRPHHDKCGTALMHGKLIYFAEV